MMRNMSRCLACVAACFVSAFLTVVAVSCAQERKVEKYEPDRKTHTNLAPGSWPPWLMGTAMVLDPSQTHIYVVVEGTGVTSATSYKCAYFKDGIDTTGGVNNAATGIDFTVNTSTITTSTGSTTQPFLQTDGNERVLLDITPDSTNSKAPKGATAKGSNGPVGSGVIVVQGHKPDTMGNDTIIGEARIRVWFKP
jgi:hypothetical protein